MVWGRGSLNSLLLPFNANPRTTDQRFPLGFCGMSFSRLSLCRQFSVSDGPVFEIKRIQFCLV
jgi:hypothetical protein